MDSNQWQKRRKWKLIELGQFSGYYTIFERIEAFSGGLVNRLFSELFSENLMSN